MKEPIQITGVWLVRRDAYAIVSVEYEGRWVEIIEERCDGSFSHICEPLGILSRAGKGYRNLEMG